MIRRFADFFLDDTTAFRGKLLNWLKQHELFCCLDSNDYYRAFTSEVLQQKPFYHSYDLIAGVGAASVIATKPGNSFESLQTFSQEQNDWLLGYLSYELKNEVEDLKSSNTISFTISDIHFFKPEILLLLKGQNLRIGVLNSDPKKVHKEILAAEEINSDSLTHSIELKPRISRQKYLDNVRKIQQHIIEGDVYELNYCQDFFAEDVEIDPFKSFAKLRKISPNPFSVFYRNKDFYTLCSSMERFLKKEGNKLISQPIKGTIARGKNFTEDKQQKQQLLGSEKERAENVMIVDLVRNDLGRSAKIGSVKVEELFGIYPFPQVFQMISTVTATIDENMQPIEAIKNAFPMGSMTGAPKIMAMELIDHYEETQRGIFSGSFGYFTPDGDFDLNVVIRTILYDAETNFLSVPVGSAITIDSVPEQEFDECLIKIEGIKRVLS